MDNNKLLKGLYPISPSLYKSDIDYLNNLKCVIESKINIFQFRSKTLSFRRKRYLLNKIAMMCQDNNVKLIINDEYMAKIVGLDSSADLAIIKISNENIDSNEANLYPLDLHDSDLISPGDLTIAIGSPFDNIYKN